MMPRRPPGEVPVALYDPSRDERDACGIGFVADAKGRPSRAIVDSALDALDDNVVRLVPFDASDEADPAGVVLVARVV